MNQFRLSVQEPLWMWHSVYALHAYNNIKGLQCVQINITNSLSIQGHTTTKPSVTMDIEPSVTVISTHCTCLQQYHSLAICVESILITFIAPSTLLTLGNIRVSKLFSSPVLQTTDQVHHPSLWFPHLLNQRQQAQECTWKQAVHPSRP